eukprot:TRINITY_DN10551_c0_g1_i1.p1 TRINITY_DN10551_c0_g1~~TRINITY_DN10551_c0_g1_i1.p1  ORF type:complete len:768 (-),score=147.06 TRINITY_DN10551_c0_g1_i1:41-2314(-)
MDYFYQAEDKDSVRFSWNTFPSSRVEYKKIIAPLGCIYSPLKRNPLQQVPYGPVSCSKCEGVLNPYSKVDINSKVWQCTICGTRNSMPQNYAGISETNLPAELMSQCTSIEYNLNKNAAVPPVFLFVVDTAIRHADELKAMKTTLLQSLETIPRNCFVGLITYGKHVSVHELSFPLFPKAVCFSGEKDVTPAQVQAMLGVGRATSGPSAPPTTLDANNRFIRPLEEIETTLTNIIEDISKDPFPEIKGERASRGTGVAISVALSLMQYTFSGQPGRVIVISGGPPTVGPGKVVSTKLSEPIRSHHHLNKEQAPHIAPASKYYSSLASRAIHQGHAVDLISCSLDQTGLLEQKSMARSTGGVMVTTETFMNHIYETCFTKLFAKAESGHLAMGFNVNVEVLNSPELKICGAIGHCATGNKKSAAVSDVVIGMGGTTRWGTAVMDPNSSLAFYWEIVNPHNKPIPQGQYAIIQFKTYYTHSSGAAFLRVTTVAHPWASPQQGLKALLPGFDQEAAAVLMARIAVHRAETHEQAPLKWLDRHLIQMTATFADYRPNIPESFVLPPTFSLYPVFMFHLRRGNLVQVFGNSPDEMTFYRHYALREGVANSLVMIQPALDAYQLDSEEPIPVLLTTASVQPERILVLDTFFHLIIFSGQTIASWRNTGFHLKPEFANVKALIEAPKRDTKEVMDTRYPSPMFIETEFNGSQARFLLAVLDPADEEGGVQQHVGTSEVAVLRSEDVSLKVFMDHLKRKAVAYEF